MLPDGLSVDHDKLPTWRKGCWLVARIPLGIVERVSDGVEEVISHNTKSTVR